VIGRPDLGTLSSGQKADFILVDRDPTTCALSDLPSTRTLATSVGGRFVYDSGLVT
jgi:predicted amidohydrolase YtcJ